MAVKKSSRGISSGLVLMVCVTWMPTAGAQAALEGAGQVSTIDCDGNVAHVTGSQNRVTVEGACTRLVVEGAGNFVTADMAAQSTINVIGTGNRIVWQAPGKTSPKVSSTGVGNSVTRAR